MNKKYLDYMWLTRVGGSILLLLSIFLPFAWMEGELSQLEAFLGEIRQSLLLYCCIVCNLAVVVLYRCNKRIAAMITSIIAVPASILAASFWVIKKYLSLRFNEKIYLIIAFLWCCCIICNLSAAVLCCCNQQIASMVISIIAAFISIFTKLVLVGTYNNMLSLWSLYTGMHSMAAFLWYCFIIICITAVIALCCCNMRTAASILCIIAALAVVPVSAYMETNHLHMFLGAYAFLTGVVVIIWSWIMD